MESRKGHPGSLGLTRWLPWNQSPGRGFFFWNIGIGLAVFESTGARAITAPTSKLKLPLEARSPDYRASSFRNTATSSFVAAAYLPSLAEAEFAAAPRHSGRWSLGWRHSWRRNPLVFVGSFRRCAGPHHRGSRLRSPHRGAANGDSRDCP